MNTSKQNDKIQGEKGKILEADRFITWLDYTFFLERKQLYAIYITRVLDSISVRFPI